MQRRETAAGACWVIEERFELAHEVGWQPLHEIEHLAGDTLSLLAPDEGAEDASLGELVFLDIETTGLGGAGALAFLVAAGRFEGAGDNQAFVLRQYLATSPPEEAAVLRALLDDYEIQSGDAVLVTYNGRTFDAPMLDERATMHRHRAGFDALRHVDLLPPVRTGLRGVLASCRLSMVETEVLRLTRPSHEVAGAEVPAHYFRYLRTQDARWLAPVVEHNALDVVSLAAILARFGALQVGAREPEAVDAIALGRLYAARGGGEQAQRFLERALDLLPVGTSRDDVLLRLADLHRRSGRRDLAVERWAEAAASRNSGIRPLVEIAKALEHDRRDYSGAIAVVEEALRRAERYRRTMPGTSHAELLQRLNRLQRRARTANISLRSEHQNRTSDHLDVH
ncbi:MAG: ribonuclease H-like domain-containing protein [Chloroflexi bacterium]|nr:ribonuclease H-like domain-containing protein [Chloroflexota bacterium]